MRKPAPGPARRLPEPEGLAVKAIALAALGLMHALAAQAPLHAQANKGWIGKRVVQKYSKFNLRTSERAAGRSVTSIEFYRVEQTNGRLLRLKAEGHGQGGWARSDDVVAVEQAIDFFNERIRVNPGDAFSHVMRATIRRANKEVDAALGDFNKAIRIDPTHAWVFTNRGALWREKKDFDKALADFNEAIRLESANAWAFANRGDVWRDKKAYDQAIADYNEAIRLDARFALAYSNRARIWASCPNATYRDAKKAVESATKGCELTEWKLAYSLSILAGAYAEAGDFAAAVNWQTKATELFVDEKNKDMSRSLVRLFQARQPLRETDF